MEERPVFLVRGEGVIDPKECIYNQQFFPSNSQFR